MATISKRDPRRASPGRSIDVSISRLRKKIESAPEDPRIIRTVRNSGYVFAVPVAPEYASP